MRRWRVGTVSMGGSLLLLGVFLLVSTFGEMSLYHVLMSWWPMILVILGVEILVGQFLRDKKDANIQYDVFSILFIGFLGTVAVSFAIVSSIGITEKVAAAITGQEITSDLPNFEENVASSVERIVLETGHDNVSIEGTNQRELHIFGTFRQYNSVETDLLITETNDYVTVNERGDTLYVTVKDIPQVDNWNHYQSSISAHILIPNDVELEVRSSGSDISLKPRTITADWKVEGANATSLHVPEESNVTVQLLGIYDVKSDFDIELEETEVDQTEEEWIDIKKSGTIEVGEAEYQILLANSYEVSVFSE